jgi:hypothetical protein
LTPPRQRDDTLAHLDLSAIARPLPCRQYRQALLDAPLQQIA